VSRLRELLGWIDYLKGLGVSAVLLGPVFESTSHGYDTIDYFHVDRRLGTDDDLIDLSRALHDAGIRLVLDGVFHHTGRDFWAFRDVLEKGTASPFADWYFLDPKRRSPCGDPFHYEGWDGHYDLVKLNVGNPAVRDHLLDAAASWIERFGIDGLRLDAADCLDREFQRRLAARCRACRPDFWLMGEMVGGDYRQLAHRGGLDSTTNYEVFKSLWSSQNDRNYFEIAFALNRQFGPDGIYRDLSLYNFADNHDVNRVASTLKDVSQLLPLYLLLFTMPGIPSLYYGSEWGARGCRTRESDAALRPAYLLDTMLRNAADSELFAALKRIIALRKDLAPLRHGDYRLMHVGNLQIAFERRDTSASLVVAINGDSRMVPVTLKIPAPDGARVVDLLSPGELFLVAHGQCSVPLPACWGRVLSVVG
jgi:glycosidase